MRKVHSVLDEQPFPEETMHLAVGVEKLPTRSFTHVAVHRVAKSTLLTALRSTS